MHEMSIVEALLENVRRETQKYPGKQVIAVQICCGALRLVVPEIMQSCFQAATLDTPLAGARLQIKEVPGRARCRQCQHEFPVEENWFECPRCHAADGELLSGNELDLTSIELDDKLS